MAANKNYSTLGEVTDLAAVSGMAMDQIPTGHYSLSEDELPLSAAQLTNFGAQINPLQTTNTSATAGRTSSFIQPMTSPDWFLLLSVGSVVVPECKAFALNGASVAAPAASATTVPQFDGTIPSTGLLSSGGLDATARYAQLDWGHSTWQAAWSFLNAYRMTMILTGKFVLFDELAAHIGACVSAEEWGGLGNPNISASRYIRRVNDRQAALNSATTGTRFIPQTMIAGDTPIAAPPPLVPVAYGGPKMDGIFGGWYPTRGVLLYPGMPVQINYLRQDNETLYYDRLVQNLGIETEITWDANYSDILTPSAGPVARGFSSAVPFKGGILKTGVLMRGVVLAPKPCVDWYRMAGNIYNTDAARAMYASALSILGQQAQMGGLAGLPDINEVNPYQAGAYNLPGPGLAEGGSKPRSAAPRVSDATRGRVSSSEESPAAGVSEVHQYPQEADHHGSRKS
jgi:hypothetical protein